MKRLEKHAQDGHLVADCVPALIGDTRRALGASGMAESRTLRELRGVGKSIEADFRALGIHTVDQLADADGDALYAGLNELTGTRQDPCVLDTFRCAVAQARDPHLPPEQTNWWWWSAQRKRS